MTGVCPDKFYGIEQTKDGSRFLVLELVDGESLPESRIDD
jgi:hypothetical protein